MFPIPIGVLILAIIGVIAILITLFLFIIIFGCNPRDEQRDNQQKQHPDV